MKNNNKAQQAKSEKACPCESGKRYTECCQPYLQQSATAATAETLMRSRYTAFSLRDESYLRHSWHPDTCPKTIYLSENTHWLGLNIKNTVAGTENDDIGEVEFVARSKTNGKANRLHETSQFGRFEQRWVYLSGK